MRTFKRAAAAVATAAVTITTFAVLSAPAQARPNEWYPCKIDGTWMWCMDL